VKGGIQMKDENNCLDFEIMSDDDDENRGILRFEE
jgi:hypothetical protein